MDGDAKITFDKLIALGQRNVSNIAKLATFVETMNGRIEHSFVSAGSDFTAMADDIAEMKHDVTEFHTETRSHFGTFHAELNSIRAKLADIKLKGEFHAGYVGEIERILSRVSAIEKHLGIAQEIAA